MAGFEFHKLLFLLLLGFVDSVILPSDVLEAKSKGIVEVVELTQSKEEPLHHEPKLKDMEKLDIYCYTGKPGDIWSRLPKVFRTANLHIHINSDEYETYKGNNESAVYRQFVENLHRWLNLVPWQQKSVSLDAFNKTCVGIKTKKPYSVTFQIKNVDFWLVGVMAGGIILFLMASTLSRNMLFYYSTGVSIGVLASVLIVVYIMSRFVPWKKGSYLVLLGGGSVSLWFLQYMWENCQKLVEAYWEYVLAYILTAGVISFAVCYWFGPVRNPRSLDLIKWTIQLFACVLIFISTQIPEVSCAVIVVILTVYNLSVYRFPFSIFLGVKKVWKRRFPTKRRLLTQDEYYRQGQEETDKALEELRKYVNSPDCNAWKTISRLSSPHKFATWVEGESHVTEDEMSAFEQSLDFDPDAGGDALTDDEEEIDFRLSSS